MTHDAVIQIAHAEAVKKGWPWVGPLLVEGKRQFSLFGRRFWRVTTNTQYAEIGCNVHVQVDDETGQVLSSDYVPTQRH